MSAQARIDKDKCSGCGVCHEYCPRKALGLKKGQTYVRPECDGCGYCLQFCILGAISLAA